MKRGNTPSSTNLKPVRQKKPKIHPLGSSILDKWHNAEERRDYFTDGFRTLGVVKGGRDG